jgi:hypothetical protein
LPQKLCDREIFGPHYGIIGLLNNNVAHIKVATI